MKETEQTLLEIADIVSALDGTISGPKDFDRRCKWLREQMDAYATAKAKASCEATPVSAPSESQEEMWQSSNPNKERYVQLSNVHSDGMPEPWLRFWEQIEIWYGDIQKRETGVQLLERLRKEGFKITRNP